jgi:hypothetical protein
LPHAVTKFVADGEMPGCCHYSPGGGPLKRRLSYRGAIDGFR